MSGPGDIGGEVSGDEAAWRDLIARFDGPADLEKDEHPWPSIEDLPGTALATPSAAEQTPGDSTDPLTAADRADGVLHTADPRNYSPPEEEDERYVPVPLPPPAKLDSMAKAAWVAVIGGPAYLLIAGLFLNLTVSPFAAFIAVAAFIGGFVALIVKAGDRSRRDDDDDGAVL
ncbi:MAG TPA: hypothetical protein VGH53_17210 [Streptosporangiaceae bacterium]|jgi:hypothetical protein